MHLPPTKYSTVPPVWHLPIHTASPCMLGWPPLCRAHSLETKDMITHPANYNHESGAHCPSLTPALCPPAIAPCSAKSDSRIRIKNPFLDGLALHYPATLAQIRR
jgi:hypothetical protein